MLVSDYTFMFINDGKHYIYNSLSNAFLEIDFPTYSLMKESKTNGSVKKELLNDEELWKILVDKRFVCESASDELLYYKSMVQPLREQRHFMHLTIAPTMDCCFNCFYCFEQYKKRENMSEEVMESIVRYVTSMTELKKILLSWFGGEPLMALPVIRQFYIKLRAEFKGEIESDIITTGYHINKDTISLFKDIGITSVQITLDGDRESHNRVKTVHGCDDVFSKILENIELLTNEIPEINVVFRVNITKDNADEYPDLFKKLYEIFPDKKISVSPAIVKNRTPLCNQDKGLRNIYLSNEEFADYVINLLCEHGIQTPFIRYPQNQMCECAIRDKMAMAFDPEGHAYKCWEKIGDKKYSVGKVNRQGRIVELNLTELNREMYGADPLCSPVCTQCRFLPICNGGCPIDRIQNEFEGYSNDTCTLFKNRFSDFLKLHLKLKEAGYDN